MSGTGGIAQWIQDNDGSGKAKDPRSATLRGWGPSDAVAVRFELTVDFHPHTLSRRAP